MLLLLIWLCSCLVLDRVMYVICSSIFIAWRRSPTSESRKSTFPLGNGSTTALWTAGTTDDGQKLTGQFYKWWGHFTEYNLMIVMSESLCNIVLGPDGHDHTIQVPW